MKVVPTNAASYAQKTNFQTPPISLDRPEKKKLAKNEYLSLTLRTEPENADSQTYELSIRYFCEGSPEEWLVFQKDLRRILQGQNVTTGPPSYAMARRVLEGDALAAFETAATQHGNETVANFNLCLKDLTSHIFPRRALQMQKRYMRRFMRKPKSMTIRAYVSRVNELNLYLPLFPPFANGQGMANDELLELLEFAVPNKWQKQFTLQGFNPSEQTPQAFVEFCERLETTEDIYTSTHVADNGTRSKGNLKSPNPDSGSKWTPKTTSGGTKRKEDKWCPLHETSLHDMSECKVLLAQAKRMKASWDTLPDRSSKTPGNKNRTYRREGGLPAKKQMLSMAEKAVEQVIATRKGKKRPREEEPIGDLDNFNIDQLSIGSDESLDDGKQSKTNQE